MEYKMKCNVCGKVFCYTDEDLKKNASNAGLGALSALGSLASTLGGGTIFHTHHLQGQADRYTDKIVDYNQCPYCHSRSLSVFTGNAEEDAKVVKAVNINTSASTESLLKRVFIFLEDGEWETADAYCEACLDKDPESGKAYLGKLMAELHVKIQGELKNQPKPFDSNANYRKAIRYGDDELRNTLIGYTKYINNRNENTRKDKVLRDAKSRMTGKAISNYEEALSLFASIAGWKDADEQKSICLSKIAELKAKEEADRLERERLAKEEAEAARVKANKQKKMAAIVVPILVVLIVVAVIISNSAKKSNDYEFALSLVESGQYADAIEYFTALGDYKDCAEQIELATNAKIEAERIAELDKQYNRAVDLLSQDEQESDYEAYLLFVELGEYKNAATYVDAFEYLLIESKQLDSDVIEYYSYDDYGRLVREEQGQDVHIYAYYENGTYSDKYIHNATIGTDYYNANGDLIRYVSSSGTEMPCVWEYYEDGSRKSMKAFIDGELLRSYEYDQEGNRTYWHINGTVYVEKVDEYDNVIQSSDGTCRYVYIYDQGRMLSYEAYSGERLFAYDYYTYDEHGSLIKHDGLSAQGKTFSYEYECTYGYIYCPNAE